MTATTTEVIGDATTAASRARRRWLRSRPVLVVLGAAVVVALITVLPAPRTSRVDLAPDNPGPRGAMALAQVLGDRGVAVRHVTTTADAVAAAGPGTTLLVTSDLLLSAEQAALLAQVPADVVLLGSGWLLGELVPGAEADWATVGEAEQRTAACDDPDAVAAGTVTFAGSGARAPGATVCFPGPTDPPGYGGLVVTEQDGRRVVALADGLPLVNDTVAQHGNAALALRLLSRHDTLVWYVPQLETGVAGEDGGPGVSDLLPPAAVAVGWLALLVTAVAAVWRARRLGPVVAEPLPVVVRAAETTRGRARLYRAARARGRAAAALRAGCAARSAQRLGLPGSAGADAVVDALARATGRPGAEVAELLYGPPPTTDQALVDLAGRLDRLESEVHRS